MEKLPIEAGDWQTLGARPIYENPWIALTEYDVLNPNGGRGVYGKVHFKHYALGVAALEADGSLWLVGQARYPLQSYSWEIPEGGGRLDRSPLESAQRELKEETGLEARSWRLLLTMHLSNSVSDEIAYIYLAQDLTAGGAEPEDTERLSVLKIPFETVYQKVIAGEITDSLSVAAVLRLKIMFLTGELFI